MAWFKVDDGLHSSRKVLSIPRSIRLAAVGLWTVAGSWSAHEELDGFVPDYMVAEWGGNQKLVDALIRSGLWEVADEGTVFHKWAEYQPTRAELEAARAKETKRKRAWRERQQSRTDDLVPAGQTEDSDRNPDTPTRPDPTRPSSTSIEVEETLHPWCGKHPGGTEDNCRACGIARVRYTTAQKEEKSKPTAIPPRLSPCEEHGHVGPADGRCERCGEWVKPEEVMAS